MCFHRLRNQITREQSSNKLFFERDIVPDRLLTVVIQIPAERYRYFGISGAAIPVSRFRHYGFGRYLRILSVL